jgi:hypothetical protein
VRRTLVVPNSCRPNESGLLILEARDEEAQTSDLGLQLSALLLAEYFALVRRWRHGSHSMLGAVRTRRVRAGGTAAMSR